MKKLLVFLLIFLVVCCSKTTTELTDITTAASNTTENLTTTRNTTTNQSTTELTTPTTTTPTTMITTELTTEIITTATSLKTEILPIYSSNYGNTNGNANNMGLVVYDSINKLHIYAVGANVYTYDPTTDETVILFSLTSGGYVTNMCLSEDYLYFVSSNDLWMLKYDFNTEEITTVSEAETYFISRYSNYVYVDMVDPTYSLRGMKVFYDDDQTFLSAFGSGIENLNISGTKIFYNQKDGTNIQVAGSTFSGKTTEANLSEYEFTEIKELHLIKDSYTTGRTYAFIASTELYTALYLYNANTGLEKILTSEDVHSLNSDTYNLFYINGSTIYKYNLETHETTVIANGDTSTRYVFVINYWIYYSNNTLSSLYRVDPDTLEVEALI